MNPLASNNIRWKGLAAVVVFCAGLLMLSVVFGLKGSRKHDFTGKCTLCHLTIPEKGTAFQDIVLKDDAEKLCANCHDMDMNASHPIGVQPKKTIPLQRYLSAQGELTCITCHDVHKEEKSFDSAQDYVGLLRGHAQKRAFCAMCHEPSSLGADWRHSLVTTYAHMSGELTQHENGALLDEFSVECLSCHDGVISTSSDVMVRSGDFQHSIGLSHPVGVEYPRFSVKNNFVPKDSLPDSIKLFNQKVGCLSCHNPYGDRKGLLTVGKNQSDLCLSCHRK